MKALNTMETGDFQVWVTSLRNGQLQYDMVSRVNVMHEGVAVACREAGRQRVLLVEIKSGSEVKWALRGGSRRMGEYDDKTDGLEPL